MYLIHAKKGEERVASQAGQLAETVVLRRTAKPLATSLVLLATDLAALAAAWALAIWGRTVLGADHLQTAYYVGLWPLLALFPIVYVVVKLYPAAGISEPDRLRRMSYSTSSVYLALAVFAFLSKSGETYSRGIFLMAWALSLVSVPFARAAVQAIFEKRRWWGCSVIILGAGETGKAVTRALKAHPGLGFKPVAFLDDDPVKQGRRIDGLPVPGGLARAEEFASAGIRHVILAMPGISRKRLLELMEAHGWPFPHVIVIPDLFGLSSLWVSARDLGGVLGLEIHEQLLLRGPRIVKRAMDLAMILIAGPLLLLTIAVIVAAIKLDSPGQAFYGHRRIGSGGREFVAWKFRSMRPDADQVLAEYLEQHPELRAEWERDHKLRNDPRVTRIGRFLRQSSLDELPQLWNVLKGEMSLVGPRPIVAAEIARYGSAFALYTKVKPGITGLWQVSGRNDTTYSERVAFDAYYARNWSIWLDLYLLVRTIKVVLTGKGAY